MFTAVIATVILNGFVYYYPTAISTITFPVVAIFNLFAVADDSLIAATFISYIFLPDHIIMNPWSWLVYHYFIAVVNIIIAITRWQRGAMHPYIIIQVNILMGINIVIRV